MTGTVVGVPMRIGGGVPPVTTEVMTAVAAAAAVKRSSQGSPTTEDDWGDLSLPGNLDAESAFSIEVCDIPKTNTSICCVSCNVDVITGPTKLEDANLIYMSKAQAIQNLH